MLDKIKKELASKPDLLAKLEDANLAFTTEKIDNNGQPILDANGQPEMETKAFNLQKATSKELVARLQQLVDTQTAGLTQTTADLDDFQVLTRCPSVAMYFQTSSTQSNTAIGVCGSPAEASHTSYIWLWNGPNQNRLRTTTSRPYRVTAYIINALHPCR